MRIARTEKLITFNITCLDCCCWVHNNQDCYYCWDSIQDHSFLRTVVCRGLMICHRWGLETGGSCTGDWTTDNHQWTRWQYQDHVNINFIQDYDLCTKILVFLLWKVNFLRLWIEISSHWPVAESVAVCFSAAFIAAIFQRGRPQSVLGCNIRESVLRANHLRTLWNDKIV